MKKIIAYSLLCLLLAGLGVAVAETASATDVTYQTYTNVPFGYTIDYPLGWILLDKDTIDYYLAQLSEDEVSVQGFTPSTLEMVKSLLQGQAEGSYVEFMDLSGNTVTITCFDYPTPSSIDFAKETLSPQLIATFQTMFTDMTVLDSGSVTAIGDKEYLKVKFQTVIYGQTNTLTVLYHFKNDLVFSFSGTWSVADPEALLELDAVFETLMASFGLE